MAKNIEFNACKLSNSWPFLFMCPYVIPSPTTIFLPAESNYSRRRVNVFRAESAKVYDFYWAYFQSELCVLATLVNSVREYLNRQIYKSFHYPKNNLLQRSRRL